MPKLLPMSGNEAALRIAMVLRANGVPDDGELKIANGLSLEYLIENALRCLMDEDGRRVIDAGNVKYPGFTYPDRSTSIVP